MIKQINIIIQILFQVPNLIIDKISNFFDKTRKKIFNLFEAIKNKF